MRSCFWILFPLLLSSSAHAVLYNGTSEVLFDDKTVVARVRVLQSQTVLGDDGESSNPHLVSFHDAEVVECISCGKEQEGDAIAIATLGGRVGQLGQHIVGAAQLNEGDEAWVYLSEPSTKWGARLAIYADEIIEGPTGQTEAYICTRVPVSGPSVFWRERQVEMRPGKSDDPSVTSEDIKDAVAWAAKQWTDPECSDFSFKTGGTATQSWIGYNWLRPEANENVVALRQSSNDDIYSQWLHLTEALAITSLVFIYGTGEIIDADIELNGEFFQFTNCDPGRRSCVVKSDIKNTLTHEFGHVAGLGHPPITFKNARQTTMFAASNEGETQKRTLHPDDVAGLCFIYPAGQETRECYGVTRKPSSNMIVAASAASCAQYNNNSNHIYFGLLLLVIASWRRRLDKNHRRGTGLSILGGFDGKAKKQRTGRE